MSTGTTTRQRKDTRRRIGDSRLGTLLVLGVTGALVMGLAYLISRPKASASGIQAVTLSGPSKGAAPKVGTPAQDFTATDVEGQPVSLSDYKGKAVWLTFGATWCAACQAEAPDIQAAYEKHKAQGAVVLAIFINEDAATVKDYADRVGLTFPKIGDADTAIASAYRVNGIPVHFFIDRAGVLRSVVTGAMTPKRMDDAIAAVS